jgi:hypothetical protein
MNFDLRLPLGLLFSLFGAMLTVYGLATGPALYVRSLGYDVNLDWGALVLAFGLLMLGFALRARRRRGGR